MLKGVGSCSGVGSGVCRNFRRLDDRWDAASGLCGSSWYAEDSEMGRSGLDGVRHRLRAGAARSRNARRAALGSDETRDRGVKNLLNFLGVMDGFRLSFPAPGDSLGGEDRSSLVSMAERLATGDDLSVVRTILAASSST